MKATALALLAALLATPFAQDPVPPQKETKKKSAPLSRFFEGESARLQKETEGSWILFNYMDPSEPPLENASSGFAMFHEGFLALTLTIQTVDQSFFRTRERLLLRTGCYRYRFDEQANLQISGMLSYTNANGEDNLGREPAGQAFEYFAKLADGVLELRNQDGVTISFRKIESGEFPAAAIQKLERRRGGVDHWERDDEPPKK